MIQTQTTVRRSVMFSASRDFPSLKLLNNKKWSELLVRQLRPFYFSSYSSSSLAQ